MYPTHTFGGSWAAFMAAGLCVAGREVTFDNGVSCLIGDINDHGGVCEGCCPVDPDRIVTYYRDLLPQYN